MTLAKPDFIRENASIEAVDDYEKLQTWYKARVIKVEQENSRFLVHFLGYNKRYDQWKNFDSTSVRPSSSATTKQIKSPQNTSKNTVNTKRKRQSLASNIDHTPPSKLDKIFKHDSMSPKPDKPQKENVESNGTTSNTKLAQTKSPTIELSTPKTIKSRSQVRSEEQSSQITDQSMKKNQIAESKSTPNATKLTKKEISTKDKHQKKVNETESVNKSDKNHLSDIDQSFFESQFKGLAALDSDGKFCCKAPGCSVVLQTPTLIQYHIETSHANLMQRTMVISVHPKLEGKQNFVSRGSVKIDELEVKCMCSKNVAQGFMIM
ncbi:MAG: hypothetical protein MHPSP_002589, partial [Paramarteilia canceri]